MIYTILTAWLSIIVLMIIAWLIFLWKNKPGIIDAFWPISISIAALQLSLTKDFNIVKLILYSLLFIWTLRLAGYLFLKRILAQHIEKRYEALSQNWNTSRNIGFFFNFQLQGVLALFIACPFIFINGLDQIFITTFIAITLIIIGIIGESIADYQLQQFKKLKTGAVCNRGLWYYSRHPNYFFEWLIWLGFATAGTAMHLGWLGFISPTLLLLLMLKVTGPITEKSSIQSKGHLYILYQKNTSMFIPWLSKKEQ